MKTTAKSKIFIVFLIFSWIFSGRPGIKQAQAAVAKVGTDTSETGTSLTLSFSHTLATGSNRLVVVSIGIENGDTIDVSTVTYGGETMTKAIEGLTGTSDFRYLSEIWYILETDLPGNGPQTVAITCSGTVSEMEINAFCAEYTGVNQGAPEATDETVYTGTAKTIANTISPSNNAWVISAVGVGNTDNTFTHGQGQVEVLDFTDTSSAFSVAELRGANGETSLDSTASGTVNRMARVAASFTQFVPILSISVSPSTWTVGTVDEGTVQISTSGNKIGVTNNGNVVETFTLQIYDEDDKDEWTHSSLKNGAGNNIYVLSGIFCATTDSPTQASFNETDSEDVLTTTQQTATSTKFAYAGGSDNAEAVPVDEQRSLWLRLDMPTAVSGTYAYEQHTVTVRINCQQP
jgi:hypothetical protein